MLGRTSRLHPAHSRWLYVLPINHALQGHPEAPCLWEKFTNYVLVEKLGFRCQPTNVARTTNVSDELNLFLSQVSFCRI
jgi:hypothetical protein